MTRTEILNALHREIGAPDHLRIGRDGIVRARWGYFYRHGRTVEHFAAGIRRAFPEGEIVSISDRFAPWPRDSFFEVRFQIVATKPANKIEEGRRFRIGQRVEITGEGRTVHWYKKVGLIRGIVARWLTETTVDVEWDGSFVSDEMDLNEIRPLTEAESEAPFKPHGPIGLRLNWGRIHDDEMWKLPRIRGGTV